MGHLLSESLEAAEFVRTELVTISGSEKGNLYFRAGIAATTGPDNTGHALSVEYLEERAGLISKYGEWIVLGHDPLVPPIGRVISARVFFAPKSNRHFLVTIMEIYPPERRLTFENVGILDFEPVSGTQFGFLIPTQPSQEPITLGYDPYEIDSALIEEMLAEAPPEVDRKPIREFRKGDDLLSLLNLHVPLFAMMPAYLMLMMTAVRDELAKRAVAGVVESSMQFYSWMVEKVVGSLSASKLQRAQVVISSDYRGCLFQFIVDSKDPVVLTEAVKAIEPSIASALTLHSKLESRDPEKIVYEYDKKLKKWHPLFVTTFRGDIISDRPYLVVQDQLPQHLSIAGYEEPSPEYVPMSNSVGLPPK